MKSALATLSALALCAGARSQQVIVTTDTGCDCIVAFSPVDGSFVSSEFAIDDIVQVCAIQVEDEIWVSQQIGDRIKRYDACGNWLGDIGPTFAGGGLDNVRGLYYSGGIVYACNDGANNGATPDSITTFDAAGNWLASYPLTGINSPFGVLPFQGGLLVSGSSGLDDVHRYTLTGVSLGTFHNSGSLNFAHQLHPAADGNVWCAGSSTDNLVKLDATTGAILTSIAANDARGVHELANGNLLWAGSGGVYVYDPVNMTSTQVYAGLNCYQLNLVDLSYACHETIGVGCHDWFSDNSNLFQLFPDVPSAKAALDGNALQLSLTPNGYVATWLPGVAGALYVPPTAGATIVADASTTTETFTPSAAIPVPGGVTTQWTVSSEGILTAGAVGNQGTDTTPSLADPDGEAGLAFYTWFSQNPTEAGSGKVKWEEVAGVLYVTFDGVETFGSPTVAPSTYQWQIDMTTGDVIMVWPSLSISTTTGDVLVGCTLAGTGAVPISQVLAVVTPFVLGPDTSLTPMSLTAAPRPVINPSTTVTYTANDVPEYVPGSNVYLGTMFLSVNPLPGGFDLNGILTTLPGCSAYIATLDLDLGGVVNVAPTLSWTFTFDNAFFAPGNVVAAQAVALFDPAFPLLNGEAGGFLLSNGLLSTTLTQ